MGLVPNDKAIRPKASPKELRRIALVKEWVHNHPSDVHSDALLGEENIRAFVSPLGHTIFYGRTIPMQPKATLARKRSPSPPPMSKGKKLLTEVAKANSSQVYPPRFVLGQSLALIEVQCHPPFVSSRLSAPSIHPSNPPRRLGGESCHPGGTSFSSFRNRFDFGAHHSPSGACRADGLLKLSQGANMLSMHFYGALLDPAPRWSALVEPLPKFNVEMIPSSPSTAQSAIEGQVFKGAAEDGTRGSNPSVENMSSTESFFAQPSREGPASTTVAIELMAAPSEEPIGRAS